VANRAEMVQCYSLCGLNIDLQIRIMGVFWQARSKHSLQQLIVCDLLNNSSVNT
jgi:hypothetical protein